MRATLAPLAVLALVAPASASAQDPRPGGPVEPDPATTTQVIVRYDSGVDAKERGEVRSDADVRREAVLPLASTELVDPEPGVSVSQAVRDLERDPDVRYAEPNAPRVAFATPRDPLFSYQAGLQNTGQALFTGDNGGTAGADISAPAAWDVTTGSPDVRVAVVDSGADTAHPDLAANFWVNPGESGVKASNGLDDDANGYVDDVNGYDFADKDAQPLDANGHGTHVAGTIGARGDNGVGVTGVAWSSSLMVLRSLGADGSGTVADVLAAYDYARRNGARVVNLSLGGDSGSQAERDALAAASGVLFVAAAGNGGDDGVGDDNDTTATGSFPCEYDLPNVICVAASDRNDRLASFSNFGARTVDLAAPGVDIVSTYPTSSTAPNGRYVFMDGTSMATPHVTGVAALALARAPRLTVRQLRDVLLSSVDALPALQPLTVTGGRLNAARAVQAAAAVAGGAPVAQSSSPTAPADTTSTAPSQSTSTASPPPPTSTSTSPPASTAPAAAPPPAAPAGSPIQAAPTAATAGAKAKDTTAPGLAVRVTRSQRFRTLRASGLRTTVSCSEACRLSFTLTVDAATGRKLGLRSRRVVVSSRTLTRASQRSFALRPSAAVRVRLRGSGRAVLQVVARDQAGNRRTRALMITLRP